MCPRSQWSWSTRAGGHWSRLEQWWPQFFVKSSQHLPITRLQQFISQAKPIKFLWSCKIKCPELIVTVATGLVSLESWWTWSLVVSVVISRSTGLWSSQLLSPSSDNICLCRVRRWESRTAAHQLQGDHWTLRHNNILNIGQHSSSSWISLHTAGLTGTDGWTIWDTFFTDTLYWC